MDNMSEEKVLSLYKVYAPSGVSPRICRIPQAGSNREYFRIYEQTGETLIGVYGRDIRENRAFIDISREFQRQGLPSPKILAVSDDFYCYLQSDLGEKSLFDILQKERESLSPQTKMLMAEVVRLLPDIQFKVGRSLDFSKCYPKKRFDRQSILFDLNYFKYCFLKPTLKDFDEVGLDRDLLRLLRLIHRTYTPEVFTYRDFQSRNIMIASGKPYFIDFQGGREGFMHYDLVSLLWQAKAQLPNSLRQELIEVYLDSAERYVSDLDRERFKDELQYFVLFRLLQVLGAYGFRGLIEKKRHFIESIPLALSSLRRVAVLEKFPILSRLINDSELYHLFFCEKEFERLTVQIESFSYKKGVPKDESTNGGGFVFDCRAIHNPGRYEEYKKQTGRDYAVQKFLEENSEVKEFLNDVYSLVDRHLDVFHRRDFRHLCVFFGCTGGQHRSVYCAEQLAKYLKKYDIDITLKHNELR